VDDQRAVADRDGVLILHIMMVLVSTPVIPVVAHDARREIGHAVSERETGSATRTLTQHDRARVWERVVVERGKGERWRDIAARAGLSERQCRRIHVAYTRSAPTLDRSELVREIEDALLGYDADIEELALVSMTTRSDVARVAAVKARMAARWRKLELLSISGVLGDMRTEIDVRVIADAVMTVFDEYNVPDDARRAVLAALPDGTASVDRAGARRPASAGSPPARRRSTTAPRRPLPGPPQAVRR
jgi:hypothetical protein